MITQSIDLNLVPSNTLERINVSQYDTGSRTLQFTLYNGVSSFSIPSGATVYIVGTKADGTGFQYECTYSDNVVSVDITDQMTVYSGEVTTELRIVSGDLVLGTCNFIINVEQTALSDDTTISETDIPIIQQIPEYVEDCEEYAELAHQWATYGDDTDTPSSTNNAYYWATKSQEYAEGALHWKGSIAFASIPTSDLTTGDFYNITDDFTTDSRFTEGSGIECAAGTNIVWSDDSLWDIVTPTSYASQVKYDGTDSGLSSTNVQNAIDEVVDDLDSLSASDVSYDTTTSGLTSTDVQSAIDELDGLVDTNTSSIDTINDTIGTDDISEIGTSVTNAITELNTDLTGLNGLHIGTTTGTFPSSVGSAYINYSDLIDDYTSDMAYKVIVLKAISYNSGYPLPTEIESSGNSAVVLTQSNNECIRLLIPSTNASAYYSSTVLIYYAWFN